MQDGFACVCAVQDWTTDVWSRGAPIGVFPPGALTSSRSCLAHSIGPVHWAGTETSVESQGYMNGALLAGMRAARHVASSLTGLVDQYYSQSTHPVSGDDVVTYSDAVLAPMVALAVPVVPSVRRPWTPAHAAVAIAVVGGVVAALLRWRRR